MCLWFAQQQDAKIRKSPVIPERINTCAALKTLIKAQLEGDLIEDFDIGYVQGDQVISMRNEIDFEKLWDSLRNEAKTMLWCNSLSVDRHQQA